MEAASEKRARGRPRKVPVELSARAAVRSPVSTERGRQDRVYAQYAEDWLGEHFPNAWVSGQGRQGIRTQLGRLLLDQRVPSRSRIVVVDRIVKRLEGVRPKTKAAERLLRQARKKLVATATEARQ
jgi:hypothetical protein